MKPRYLAMFPGQGSQYVGMAKEVLTNFPATVRLFEESEDACRVNLRKLILDGPESDLKLTANQQPAILVTSVAIWSVLKQETGFVPALFAGHSLGEYSALVASEKLALFDAARLVRIRGEAMQQAVPEGLGAMAAVLRWKSDDLINLCEETARQCGRVVEVANFNSPSQQIISGHSEAVDLVVQSLRSQKVLCKALKVSAPFHSSLMSPAKAEMREHLSAADLQSNDAVILPNITGEATTAYEVGFLIDQIDHPVLWTQTVEAAIASGIDAFVEVGPGAVLTGLLKRWVDPDLLRFNSDPIAKAIPQLQA